MTKTVDEIAKLAGVSVTSVRLVINGQDKKYRISEKTRDKIQGIIKQHGYTINQTARNLKLKQTRTIGLIIPSLTNPFFAFLTEELEANCRAAGYQLITACSGDDEEKEESVFKNLMARGVDGLFITPSSAERQTALGSNENGKPIVILDRDFGISSFPVVATDNYNGGVVIGKKLANMASELFFLGAGISLPSVQARLKGLIVGLGSNGFKLTDNEIILHGKNERMNGYLIMQQICQRLGRAPLGIVTVSLPILEGAMEYLHKTYGKIAPDMVIGSFDDHPMLEFCPNPVVSMKQNTKLLSELSIKLMKQLLNKEASESKLHIVKPIIIEK
ncbi:hypothetical protein GZ77_25770 [Endozoicomonas montiporae]|uniref:HTH lacI-type domain-containing protein n=3 Tax=Endozoicomonas montiporae TaxID=1027273 RepID=A0A081MZ78_9GAMM|nr:transcriptional regulator [Endozoicomonas montiporae CL-33]KEQ11501.1 hypothetical protein GZ77_25770 [Endozoicomonas montiporae]